MVSIGNDPQMAARFRLVKYDNLPRNMIVTYCDQDMTANRTDIEMIVLFC